ncbi:S-adenosyl-L-methionine-dependent methyltransferase [Hymenopellis radicata]|nr:S-adenosyl-L-methionine-dependent methyltransferase [Hymenopellis radicata]
MPCSNSARYYSRAAPNALFGWPTDRDIWKRDIWARGVTSSAIFGGFEAQIVQKCADLRTIFEGRAAGVLVEFPGPSQSCYESCNQSGMEDTLSSTFTRVTSTVSGFYSSYLGQTKESARLNVISSYDRSNELFKAFLSQEMMYSCALWDDAEGGVRGDLDLGPTPGDLEAAQRRKLHHVLRQARVKPVITLTLSIEQKTLTEEQIMAAGLCDKITCWENAFDAFASVKMLEHVGSQHYARYFDLVSFALKPYGATAVVSASTFPESRYSSYQAEDFMRKYMWPNSCRRPPLSSPALIWIASGTTLRSSNPQGVGQAFGEELDTGDGGEGLPGLHDNRAYDAFKKKWLYLFSYGGAGFAKGCC